MAKPITQLVSEDKMEGLIVEVSDSEVYYGWPATPTTTVAEAKWKVYRMKKVSTNGGASTYIGGFADGNENYDNVFNPNNLAAIQALTYIDHGVTAL